MTTVVSRYVLVTDTQLLQNALDRHGLRYRKDQPPECWAYDLFRQTRGQFAGLADLGLSKNLEAETFILWRDLESMNSEYLEVSEGHYERYFRQPLAFD